MMKMIVTTAIVTIGGIVTETGKGMIEEMTGEKGTKIEIEGKIEILIEGTVIQTGEGIVLEEVTMNQGSRMSLGLLSMYFLLNIFAKLMYCPLKYKPTMI